MERCRYCGGLYNASSITREHVIPRWLIRMIQRYFDNCKVLCIRYGKSYYEKLSIPIQMDTRNLIPVCMTCNKIKSSTIIKITQEFLEFVYWSDEEELLKFLEYLHEYKDVLYPYVDSDVQQVIDSYFGG